MLEEQTRDGDLVCTGCGLTLISSIRVEKDWNDYQDDQGIFSNNARCHVSSDPSNPFDNGALPMYPKGYTQEYIGKDGKKRKFDMSRLNVRYIPHKQKDFWQVSCKLKEACVKLNATGIICENAKNIWSIIAKSDKVCRGANRRGIIGNCILYACYKCKSYRKQDEIADALIIPSSEITKGRKIFKEILLSQGKTDILNLTSCEESKFTSLARNLGVPKTHWIVVKKSEDMYKNLEDELSILAPSSGIAGVLFYNLREYKLKVTKSQIKETCEVCTPTLNKALKIIEKAIALKKSR
tara:strand:- start:2888 stop:3775 length:888 start_codon:yes stop_codon:yes gene_type:complete